MFRPIPLIPDPLLGFWKFQPTPFIVDPGMLPTRELVLRTSFLSFPHQMSPLEEVVKKYCEERKISLNGVRIYFDGEEASLADTPATLEMENDDIIDLEQN